MNIQEVNNLLTQAEVGGIQKFVVGAVIEKDRKVLLLKRREDDFMGGLVELPSGTVEEGEGLLDALTREVKEETGLKVESVDELLGSFDYLSRSGKKTRQFNFRVTAEGEMSLDGKEHIEYQWVDPVSDLRQKLNITEEVQNILDSLHL